MKKNDISRLREAALGLLATGLMGVTGVATAGTAYTLTVNDPPGPSLNPTLGDSANFSDSGATGTVYTDNWNFQVSTAAKQLDQIVNISTSPDTNISGLTMGLYKGSFSGTPPAMDLITTGPTIEVSEPAGAYDLYITGTNSGTWGGAYGGSIFTQPIPLPAAAWLFGSGLGLLGLRKRKQAA